MPLFFFFVWLIWLLFFPPIWLTHGFTGFKIEFPVDAVVIGKADVDCVSVCGTEGEDDGKDFSNSLYLSLTALKEENQAGFEE